jgi:hypothetical protein
MKKSQEDDFPPTLAAPPPPELPDPPPADDPRATTHTNHGYEGVEQLLPARTWKENPLVWIALVVAMFMAVPLLASIATRDPSAKAPKTRADAAASMPGEAPPAQADVVPVFSPAQAPRTSATPAPANVNELPPNLRPQTDASRQMITKCYENGRVVYTQTGACTGSMTAVPIDTGKNVVGPGAAAAAGGTR